MADAGLGRPTVHQLLTHTGGVADVSHPSAGPDELRTVQDYVGPLGEPRLRFEPRTGWHYNNHGFNRPPPHHHDPGTQIAPTSRQTVQAKREHVARTSRPRHPRSSPARAGR
ncbi:serine hydrolase [Actinomadura geliboluensis]|uniref:serine hydrolase n=1 Tax=Actinomadura geliboluensis TaxID=882440 RepID=UPI0037170C62